MEQTSACTSSPGQVRAQKSVLAQREESTQRKNEAGSRWDSWDHRVVLTVLTHRIVKLQNFERVLVISQPEVLEWKFKITEIIAFFLLKPK